MEAQGWWLKRMLSFTSNRLINRPNRPRDKKLLKYLKDIGYEWPEDDGDNEGEHGGDEDDAEGNEALQDGADGNEGVEGCDGDEGGRHLKARWNLRMICAKMLRRNGGAQTCLPSMSLHHPALPHQCQLQDQWKPDPHPRAMTLPAPERWMSQSEC